MPSNFEDFLRAAEDHYLQPDEMNGFKQQVDTLQDRLDLYETLRDQELMIIQPIPQHLPTTLSSIPQADLEKVLTHWISVLRYSAMAMLLNQPEILNDQLLGWVADVLKEDRFSVLNQTISGLLHQSLQSILNEQQIGLIEPFLKQADALLVDENSNRELVALG